MSRRFTFWLPALRLRLGPRVWIRPDLISSIQWEPLTGGGDELRIYHPDAAADYFVVHRDCIFDLVKALGIERPPAAEKSEAPDQHG